MKTITTKIKWRNAAEELPKESCEVVVWRSSSNSVMSLQYSALHGRFNCCDFYSKELAARVAIAVDYWCYLDEVLMALTTFPEEKPLPGKFEPARGKKKIKFREEAMKLKMTPREVMQAFRDSARFMQISYNGKDGILAYFLDDQTRAGVIYALHKQIPQAMRRVDDEGFSAYICPVCGNPFAGNRYCDRCGQRLEW